MRMSKETDDGGKYKYKVRCVVWCLHRLWVPAHNVTPIADFRPTLPDVLTGSCTALSGSQSNLNPMLEVSTAAGHHEGAYYGSL